MRSELWKQLAGTETDLILIQDHNGTLQQNDVDCGVFALQFAIRLAAGEAVPQKFSRAVV